MTEAKTVVELVDHVPAWALIAAVAAGIVAGIAFAYLFVDFTEETPNA